MADGVIIPHQSQKKNKRSSSKHSNKISVTFLKDRSRDFQNEVQKLRNSSNRKSSLSLSSKKEIKKKLNKVLWFDQIRFKWYLIKLRKFVKISLDVDLANSLSWVIRRYEEVALRNGPLYAVQLFKQLHDIYIRIIVSHSFQVPPYISVNSSGEPKLLGPLLDLAKGSLNERRAGLHAIQVIKLVDVQNADFSLKTIIQSPPLEMLDLSLPCIPGSYLERMEDNNFQEHVEIDINRITTCWKEVLEETFPSRERDRRLQDIARKSKLHVSGRNGPNGPCLTTVVIDHSSLAPLRTGSSDLFLAITAMSKVSQNASLLNYILSFEDEPYTWTNSERILPCDSKLSLKFEAWGKTRVFAICDWFSQSVLSGLHANLFSWLADQIEDGTFDQDRTSEAVKDWTMDQEIKPESADLSAATDSIPVEVQAEIVTQIAGPEFSVLWRRICCDRDFKVPNSTNTVRYKTGQPMGILSSWAMLAVWHHMVLRTCLKYLGDSRDPSCAKYVVVGDDISMKGTDLFFVYEQLVGKLWGIGISKSKGFHTETVTSRNPIPDMKHQETPNVAEFAKRIFYNGQEISVVPPDELLSAFEEATQFPELLDSLSRRGYPHLDSVALPDLTGLCRHSRLALLLATNPVRLGPRRVTQVLTESGPYSSIPWFKPGFDEKKFERLFIKAIKKQLITVLLRTLTNVNNWIRWSLQEDETKVKAWNYECLTQLDLLRTIAKRIAGDVSELADEADEVFKVGNLSWLRAKKFLGKLQKIFEVDYLTKEQSISKSQTQKHFANTLLAKVIKEIARG